MTSKQLSLFVSGVCASFTRVHYSIILNRLDNIDDRLYTEKLNYFDLSIQLKQAYTYYLEFMQIINPVQFNKYVRS